MDLRPLDPTKHAEPLGPGELPILREEALRTTAVLIAAELILRPEAESLQHDAQLCEAGLAWQPQSVGFPPDEADVEFERQILDLLIRYVPEHKAEISRRVSAMVEHWYESKTL